MTELSKTALADGQALRSFMNYLQETYKDLKGKTFTGCDTKFTNYIEYCEMLKELADFMIQLENESKKENESIDC